MSGSSYVAPYVSNGTVKQGNYFKIKLTGVENNKYTICGVGNCEHSSIPTGGYYRFSGQGTITIYDFTKNLWIDRFVIYLGSKKVRTIDCWGGNIF